MEDPPIGFAVLYRWRLVPGTEERFRSAWRRMTEAIREQRGGRGSRLHRAEDGTWWAYAQWPDRASWERSRSLPSADEESSRAMAAAIAEAFDPVLLEPVDDLLQG